MKRLTLAWLLCCYLHPFDSFGQEEFQEEKVSIKNPRYEKVLQGILTQPSGRNLNHSVLLIGSPDTNRDGFTQGQSPLKILAEEFTKAGFTVLRFDGRESVEYGKELTDSYTIDEAYQDALHALKLLQKNKPDKLTIAGFREGCIMAGMLAGRQDNISNLLLLAPPVLPGDEHYLSLDAHVLKGNGVPDSSIVKWKDLFHIIFKIIVLENSAAQAREQIKHTLDNQLPWFTREEKKLLGLSTLKVGQFCDEWYHPKRQKRLNFDPLEDISATEIPVLTVFSENDPLLPIEPNVTALEDMIFYLNRERITIKKLDALNHLFQPCTTCTLEEVPGLESPFPDSMIQMMRNWIQLSVR